MSDAFIEYATRPCIVCHKSGIVTVPAEGFRRWRNGAFVQDAFPDLSADEREQLITGTHGPCFDELFPEEEGDDEEEDSFWEDGSLLDG